MCFLGTSGGNPEFCDKRRWGSAGDVENDYFYQRRKEEDENKNNGNLLKRNQSNSGPLLRAEERKSGRAGGWIGQVREERLVFTITITIVKLIKLTYSNVIDSLLILLH